MAEAGDPGGTAPPQGDPEEPKQVPAESASVPGASREVPWRAAPRRLEQGQTRRGLSPLLCGSGGLFFRTQNTGRGELVLPEGASGLSGGPTEVEERRVRLQARCVSVRGSGSGSSPGVSAEALASLAWIRALTG